MWSGKFDIEHSQEKKKCFPPLAGAGVVGATYPTYVNSLISPPLYVIMILSTHVTLEVVGLPSMDDIALVGHSEMFTELYREEKKEAGDRGGQKDKRGK